MGRAGSLVSHDALGRGHDGNTQAVEDPGQLVSTGIDTQAGLGNAAKTSDDLLLAGVVLQSNADDALSRMRVSISAMGSVMCMSLPSFLNDGP